MKDNIKIDHIASKNRALGKEIENDEYYNIVDNPDKYINISNVERRNKLSNMIYGLSIYLQTNAKKYNIFNMDETFIFIQKMQYIYPLINYSFDELICILETEF